MNRRNFSIASASLLLAGYSGIVLAQAPARTAVPAKLTIASAINKAGRQRMLSQRMAKAYAQLGVGILPERAFKILNDSTTLFESQLAELTSFAPNADIAKTYAELGQAWRGYKEVLATAPAPELGARIQDANELVLQLANRGTQELERASGTNAGRLVNISGRQRMLSQRTAMFFMFREWGLPKPVETALGNVRTEFRAALNTLRVDPETTDEIKTQLGLAETQWLFFDAAVEASLKSKADAVRRQNVANSSERILEVFETVTGLYERNASARA
ncbi:MAG: hypothetical protein EAZ30_04440 [Betaproteobacteria bacterium]|nr:MAG: hypothetical protein EAZ30_04440 [Betaproteobacteria bacterium]